ncbi:hypothetical protein MRX96_014365 [Rhipicephalus microplus]
MAMLVKDVHLPASLMPELNLPKHKEYLASYGTKKDDYEYCITEHLRMSGIYWGLTAMDLMVQILATFDALNTIDIDKTVSYVKELQQEDGSFYGDKWGEVDTRFSFCAVACLALLNKLHAINVEKAVEFVVSCMNFDGGFGCRPGSETHSGQIYCCLGTLSILGRLHHINADLLGWWLCERQLPSGGLNGRPEKLPDVCYSWWVLASLKIIGRLHWIDKEKLQNFILSSQDEETGGFGDRPGRHGE